MPEIPDVVILAGGFGLRLRGMIGDVPKPMAPIAGRPFLELLLRQLKRHGFSRVVLSVGYKQEVIREHFGEKAFGLQLGYSIETNPLGTGGALREAAHRIRTDAGSVVLDPKGKVRAFAEKRHVPESRYLSAGVYVLSRNLIAGIPQGSKISLEEQLFPQWLADGKSIEGFVCEGQCLDIGTPERYMKAQHALEKVEMETYIESEGRS